MDELYTEVRVEKKRGVSSNVVRTIMIVVTVLFLVFGVAMMAALYLIIGAAFIIIDVFYFPRLDVEYEYLYVSAGTLDFDKIFSKKKRKSMYTVQLNNIEVMAPVGSPELNPYAGVKLIDYTSGYEGRDVYELVDFSSGSKLRIRFEPNEIILTDMKRKMPRKVFLKDAYGSYRSK